MDDFLTRGWEGRESYLQSQLLNRGVTLEQHETKMTNLIKLAKDGFRKIKVIDHDKYEIEGKDGFYNPYTDTFIN